MRPKFHFIETELEELKKNSLYRKLKNTHQKGSKIKIQDKILLNLCSNDYLGIPTTKLPSTQMQSSSRLVSGNDLSYKILEKKLSKHKSQQSALIYPTGYMANIGTISSIAKRGDLVLSDELNHASIIEACKLSDAKIVIYKHNDIDDLLKKIKQKAKNKFIITEGVFSMDGDFAKLKEISEISDKNNAITILDDAHGDFILGKDGKGTANHLGVTKKIDIYISSLSKGLGSFGGYVASKKNIIEYSTNKSKSFIYTSALPTFFVNYSIKRFDTNREKYRKKLLKNTRMIANGLKQIGYQINSKSQIIPIIIGEEKLAMEFGKFLFNQGVFVQPIRYPTVPKNSSRLRISITSMITQKEINAALSVFEKAYKRFKL